MAAKIDQVEWERRIYNSGSGKYTLIGWCGAGSRGSASKVTVKCVHDGYEWSARVMNLIHRGSGCPMCTKKRVWTEAEQMEKIKNISGILFLGWVGAYVNNKSKARVRCEKDGFEWNVSVSDLVHAGSRCPKCSGLLKKSEEERVTDINSIYGIRFVRWVSGYKNSYSRAEFVCSNGHHHEATVNSIVNINRGCPKCAKYGYDTSKDGYLYALRSSCGSYVKIGISNRINGRFPELKRGTPFEFSKIEMIKGDGLHILKLEKHFHSKYESACFAGFDGATEWLVCTDDLLKELIEVAQ